MENGLPFSVRSPWTISSPPVRHKELFFWQHKTGRGPWHESEATGTRSGHRFGSGPFPEDLSGLRAGAVSHKNRPDKPVRSGGLVPWYLQRFSSLPISRKHRHTSSPLQAAYATCGRSSFSISPTTEGPRLVHWKSKRILSRVPESPCSAWSGRIPAVTYRRRS